MVLEEESQQQRFKHLEDLQSFPTLPPEIVFEILVRLPVESLLRCSCVSKSWHFLISDTRFVKSHLSFSTSNNHYLHRRLIFRTMSRKNPESCPLYEVMYHKSFNPLELDYPLKHNNESIWIVGSYNGLVCIESELSGLFIWNPSARRSNTLPYSCFRSPTRWPEDVTYSFGFDESTDDYKVIAVSCFDNKVMIYSLKSGNWKNVDGFPHGILLHNYSGKFLNGAVHWEASSKFDSSDLYSWTIVSLDLAKETYIKVLQPVDDEYHHLTLGVLGECLCVTCNFFGHGNRYADVWVMKVYGVKDSWTKLVSIQLPFGNVRDQFWRPLCMADDGKILLQYGVELVVYDVKNGSSSKIKNYDDCFQLYTFVESLVSPFA